MRSLPNSRHWLAVPLALCLTLVSGRLDAQSIGDQCEPVIRGLPAAERPSSGPDEMMLAALLPYLDGKALREAAWPGPAVLDSLWTADSAALLGTLAFVLSDNLYFSPQEQAAAAGAYRRLNGPAQALLNLLSDPRTDVARTSIVDALPPQLEPQQELQLFRQACLLGSAISALTPALGEMEGIGAQIGPPSALSSWVWNLERMRDRLSGTLAPTFDSILGPVLLRGQAVPAYWHRQ